jgi:hypothetical protein
LDARTKEAVKPVAQTGEGEMVDVHRCRGGKSPD